MFTAEERRTAKLKLSWGRGLHGGAPINRDCLVQFSASTADAFVRVGGGSGGMGSGEWRWCGAHPLRTGGFRLEV